MAATFTLDIVTPERVLSSIHNAVSVVIPGSEGYFGVLAEHAPLITQLIPGELRLAQNDGTQEVMAVSGGFVEVTPDKVIVLADTAERAPEIDVDRARESLKRAEERLSAAQPGTDIDRARIAMLKAMARLRVAGQKIAI
ncbi:MAG: F0F1 ATP synthase subunit epsilon [Armatimonadota bacterium]